MLHSIPLLLQKNLDASLQIESMVFQDLPWIEERLESLLNFEYGRLLGSQNLLSDLREQRDGREGRPSRFLSTKHYSF